jgi:hypothetical protein
MWVAHALDVDCPCNYENNVDGIIKHTFEWFYKFNNIYIYIYLLSYGKYIVIFKLLSPCTLPLDACSKIKSES